MYVLRLLLFTGWLATLAPSVYGGHCTQYYSCQKSQRYSTKCGAFGWKRCTRYRTVNSRCSKQVCCAGYTGSGCNQAICFGSTSCPNGGTCVSPDTCSCRPGYASPRCADINECASSPCQNGGRCINELNRYRCVCAAGYTGVNCQNDVNECSSNNGGCAHQCRNVRGSFICRCNNGYSLAADNRGCNDMDECAAGTSGCAHACTNTVGSFRCSCNAGYALGGDGKSCNDVNECQTNNGGCPQTCTNQVGSYRCGCHAGFTLHSDARTCVDVDECARGMANCHVLATCTNTLGSFSCVCTSGYTGNGVDCKDLDECTIANGGCVQACVNDRGSFHCDCFPGYKMGADGVTCEDIDECQQKICSDSCANTVGSFVCSCPEGFQLSSNGRTCVDKNECSSNNGGCPQLCINLPGSFQCKCRPGFQEASNGTTCEDKNECTSFNGGCQDICINTPGSYQCTCSSGELSSNGFGCEGSTEPSVFERKSIARKLLPRGCAVVTLTRCTEGANVEIRLSSTSDWYQVTFDPSIIFTLGIVFIEVNDLALPMSITGMEIHNPNGNFMMKMGSLTYDEADGTVLGTSRNDDCLSFDLTPKDVREFMISDSFLATYLEDIYRALPNWVKFTSTGTDILFINDLKTDLLHGRDVQKVSACRGAPLFDDKLYSIFHFSSGFNLSVYGNEISLPKPLNGQEFCLIVDICRAYGGTIFLMFPPESRDLLSQLKVIREMQEGSGIELFLNGIGLSIVKEINVHHSASELTFWNGDEFFQYPVFPKAHLWTGGSISKNMSLLENKDVTIVKDYLSVKNVTFFFDVSLDMNLYIGLPNNPLSLLTHVFLEEWNALATVKAVTPLSTLKFKLFGKYHIIKIKDLGVSSLEFHMSVGGLAPRQWCGANANPPGVFLSMRLSINPFRNIPILGDWIFDNRHTVYAFLTYDQSDKIKNLPTVDLIQDIIDIQQIVSHFVQVFNTNLQRFRDLLSNTQAALLTLVRSALVNLTNDIQQIASDIQSLTFPDLSPILDTIRDAWSNLKVAAQAFLDAVEFNVEIAKHNFTEMIKYEVDRIKNNVDAVTQNATDQVMALSKDFSGFGVRYRTTIKVFGLEIFGLQLELVYSVGQLGQCSRYQKVYQLLAGEKAARVLAIGSTQQKLGYFIILSKGSGIGAAFGLESRKVILQIHAQLGLLGIRAQADVFITKNSLTTYIEGKVWSLFRARLTMSAELGKNWYELRYIVEGALLAGGSDSFQGSFLDALKQQANKLANEADKRISQAQQGLTWAQGKLDKAQDWLDKKKAKVRNAEGVFDDAVAALGRVKQRLEAAKGPFRRALEKLKAAQKNVDDLCRIRDCREICIPGIKCKWCRTGGWIKIPYPCCRFTSCMIRIPDPICLAANLVCRGIRFVAYGALELAKIAVKAPMVALDVAKAGVSVAQMVVDKSRVVLDVAEAAFDVAKFALDGVKATFEVAKGALEGVKFAVRAAFKVFDLIVTYGLQSIIDVKQCGFRIELSTVDLPIFDVSCEVNAFRLGWKTIRIRINFKNIVQSIWEAAKSTINALLDALKGALSGRKRREIEFDVNAKMHDLYRVIRQTGDIDAGEQFLNETLDVTDRITGFKNTSFSDPNDLTDRDNRIAVFAEKCAEFTEAEDYLRRVFDSLFSAASDSKTSLDNVTSVSRSIPDSDTIQLTNGTLDSFGVNASVGARDYNLTAAEMESAFANTLANIRDDPELKEALEASTFAKNVIREEAEEASKLDLVDVWVSAVENMTVQQYTQDICANFRDCVLYNIQRFYDLYTSDLKIPDADRIRGNLPGLEDAILKVLNSVEAITVEDAYRLSGDIVRRLDDVKAHDVFCKTAPQIVSGPRNLTVSAGTAVRLECNATGDPEPTYAWFKDGRDLGISTKYLVFRSAAKYDEAAYTCRAENYIAGAETDPAYLTVNVGEITCPYAFSMFGHPTDCSKFVTCVWSRPVIFTCPGQLVWDDVTMACNYAREVPRCDNTQA